MAVDYYTFAEEDGISAAEQRLYDLIMDYREGLGLPGIPLSPSLSLVAARHAVDTVENVGRFAGHSWSDAPYDAADPATYPTMWQAPQRLGTPYPGDAYEITTGFTEVGAFEMTPEVALANYQASPVHDPIITNSGPWDIGDWQAIGIGLYEGVAHVWFGFEADPVAFDTDTDTGDDPGDNAGDDTGDGTPDPGTGPLSATEAREVAYLYEAALDRDGAIDLGGLNFWIDRREAGLSALDLAERFVASPEFVGSVGDVDALGDADLVRALYRNVLDREGEATGVAFWVGRLEAGMSEPDLVLAFARSPENRDGSPYVETLVEGPEGDWAFAG